MTSSNESILVFEYFTASGVKDKSIVCEAESLLFTLIGELKGYDLDVIINESYDVGIYDNVNFILINEDIFSWLEKNASKYSKAIFIAGENENNLYKLTRILEENNVEIYNSSSHACYITSNKYLTYECLKDKVNQPDTAEITIDSHWKEYVRAIYEDWNFKKLILKPSLGVDCDNILIVDDITQDLKDVFPSGSKVLVQEFITGVDVSVSLICNDNDITPVSLNKQYINLEEGKYIGGKIPFHCKYEKEIFRIAEKACELIEGLKGFVGVDLIIAEQDYDFKVYLLEINSRFTTPYVGLQSITNFNIAESIIENKKINVILDGEVEFKKNDDNLIIKGGL